MLLQRLSDRHGHESFRDTHQWSTEHLGEFWLEAWSDLGIVGNPGSLAVTGTGFSDTQWFPGATLNVVILAIGIFAKRELCTCLRKEFHSPFWGTFVPRACEQ